MGDTKKVKIEDYFTYEPNYFSSNDIIFSSLKKLNWEDKVSARREIWMCDDSKKVYTYGSSEYTKHTFNPQPFDGLPHLLEQSLPDSYEDCHLNYYEGQHSFIGWHADDSTLLKSGGKIAVVSFGAVREIWFREKGTKSPVVKLPLESGSLLTMLPGCQDKLLHRIPKNDRPCELRISLTYRQLI